MLLWPSRTDTRSSGTPCNNRSTANVSRSRNLHRTRRRRELDASYSLSHPGTKALNSGVGRGPISANLRQNPRAEGPLPSSGRQSASLTLTSNFPEADFGGIKCGVPSQLQRYAIPICPAAQKAAGFLLSASEMGKLALEGVDVGQDHPSIKSMSRDESPTALFQMLFPGASS